MNRKHVEREGKKWLDAGIITEEQLQQIVDQYPHRQGKSSLLLIFAGLFIGLGFLSFIASNWSYISSAGKMTIILVSMLGFYLGGDWLYHNRSKMLGISFYIIGLLIFGSGIFLVGQMYHYTIYSSLPFVIWTLAAFLLYLVRQENLLLVMGFIILTVGQVYSAINYSSFGWILYGLLLLGFGYFTYKKEKQLFGSLFALSFVIQSLVLLLVEHYEYIWYFLFLLLLYLVSDWIRKPFLIRPFRVVALISAFILNVVHVFVLDNDYVLSGFEGELWYLIAFVLLTAAGIIYKWKVKDLDHLVDLVLFIPVFYLDEIASFASLILLFAFSVSWLVIGYRDEDRERINIGTATFLISTIVAYIQLAWDYMDKSLFFFLGGVFLFALSYFLEKRRRKISRNKRGDQE
ncbi:MAG: DUF2157 domain-containing protein [Bacillaceae bacterium]|nr:DUF2157 domain-containing protein [Bacillaceae bacterium]